MELHKKQTKKYTSISARKKIKTNYTSISATTGQSYYTPQNTGSQIEYEHYKQ